MDAGISKAAARITFAITAAVVFVGLALQLIAVVRATDSVFPTVAGRVINMFCYFTVQSNVIVGVTCLLLALRLDRTSTVFKVFRLDGVLAITITGIVYHLALSGLRELTGYEAVANQLLHTASPILCALGWLAFGPRGLTSRRVVGWAVAFPVAWVVFTLIRGPIAHFYPYPFVDVGDLGYLRVAVNVVGIAVLFLVLAALATVLDARLARRLSTPNH